MNSALRIPLAFILVLTFACGEHVPTEPAVDALESEHALARGGEKGKPDKPGDEPEDPGDPIVEAADPPSATQDTTLDVEILGENFEAGSIVDFELDEVATDDITTNATTFMDSNRLIANITISADAAEALYDVAVRTPRGRKGVGLELFAVTRKGNPNEPFIHVSFVDPATNEDATRRYFGDSLGPYTGSVEDVAAGVARQFTFKPNSGANGRWAGDRTACLRFTDAQEVTGAGIPGILADDLDATGRVCNGGDFRTVWHSNGDLGLEAMTLDQTIRAEARLIWQDDRKNQFKLEFFCAEDRGIDGGSTACENLLDVTLEAESETSRTWRVSFDASRVAVLSANSTKGGIQPFEPIAAFHLPFELTVREALEP